jgi:hypothetical protein
METGRRLGQELAFNHGIDIGRGRSIGLYPRLFFAASTPQPYDAEIAIARQKFLRCLVS